MKESILRATPIIEFEQVSFSYDDPVVGTIPALIDVSFALEGGRTYALTGPNGCGKSTALRIMNGLAFPSSGCYRFDGVTVDAAMMRDRVAAKRLHQRLGYIFQDADTQLFCPSVREEIAFGPRQMGLDEEEVERRCRDMFEMLEITHLADRAPYRLSGGEKRRVALACIISMNPDVLVLDEPMAGLDEDGQTWLMEFLKRFSRTGKTILVTTHERDTVDVLSALEIRLTREHQLAAL